MKTKNLTQIVLIVAIVILSSVLTNAQVSISETTLKNETICESNNTHNSESDTIELDFIPVIGSYETIRGHVYNVDRSKFRMACFIYVPYYGWINKPYWDSPSVPIDSTGNWELRYCTGGYDFEATILGLFLIPKEYSVPLIGGASAIPQEVYEKNIAYRFITRDTIPNTMLTLLNDSVCLGEYATLQASGGAHYFWTATKDTTSIISYKANIPGDQIIKVEISDGNGNGVIKSEIVHVIAMEVEPYFTSVLPGDSVVLSVSQSVINDFVNFKWNHEGQVTPSIKVSPNKYSVYTITGTSKRGGCQLTASAHVNLLNKLTISLNPDSVIFKGNTVTLIANGNYGDKYLWNNGETTQSINVTPDRTTTYTVEISNEIYTYSKTLSISVKLLIPVSADTNPINNLMIYPNPASDFINIYFNYNHQVTCSIKSIQGVEVAHFTFSGKTKVSTSYLKSGCYIVEIITENRKFQTKLIISK